MTKEFFGVAGVYEFGWIPPEDADIDQVGAKDLPRVRRLGTSFTWAEADMLNWLAEHPDEGASQYLDVEDYEQETKRRARSVARRTPHEERRWSLWAHEEILRAPPEIRSAFTTDYEPEKFEAAPLPVREVLERDYEEGKPPTVRSIREAAEAYEGKAKPDIGLRHCPACGAREDHWERPPIELEEEASEAPEEGHQQKTAS
jgi:hypothetical protein